MLKVKFFMGGPDDINKDFQEWQDPNTIEIKQVHHAITTTFMPMPAISLPRLPRKMPGMEAGQLTTILSVMVLYEDFLDRPA